MRSGILRCYAKTLKLRRRQKALRAVGKRVRMQAQEGSGFVEVERAHG